MGSTLLIFPPLSANFAGAINAPQFGVRNGHRIISFDDTIEEECFYVGVMPEGYTDEGLDVDIAWLSEDQITGDVIWEVAFERHDANGLDLDVDSFAVAKIVASTAAASNAGATQYATISFGLAEIDGITGKEQFRIRVRRVIDTSSTLINDAQIVTVTMRQDSEPGGAGGGFFSDGGGVDAAIGKGATAPTAEGVNSFAHGSECEAEGANSFAQGFNNAMGVGDDRNFLQGSGNTAILDDGFAQGLNNTVRFRGLAQGSGNTPGTNSLAQGLNNDCDYYDNNFAQGSGNTANGAGQGFAQGLNNVADGQNVFAQGDNNDVGSASRHSFVQGQNNTISGERYSFAQGQGNIVSAFQSFAQGRNNTAATYYAFAWGYSSYAQGGGYPGGSSAVAMGVNARAVGRSTFATGRFSYATGERSFSHGTESRATLDDQRAWGSNRATAAAAQRSFIVKHVQTTDAVQTTLFSFTLTEDKTYAFRILMAVRNTTTDAESASFVLAQGTAYRDTAGAAVVVGGPKSLTREDSGGGAVNLLADIVAATNDVQLRVTGEAGETYEWCATIEMMEVLG